LPRTSQRLASQHSASTGKRANHALSTVTRDSLRKVDVPSASGFLIKELMPRTSQRFALQRLYRLPSQPSTFNCHQRQPTKSGRSFSSRLRPKMSRGRGQASASPHSAFTGLSSQPSTFKLSSETAYEKAIVPPEASSDYKSECWGHDRLPSHQRTFISVHRDGT
jgi:hypothetical protein